MKVTIPFGMKKNSTELNKSHNNWLDSRPGVNVVWFLAKVVTPAGQPDRYGDT